MNKTRPLVAIVDDEEGIRTAYRRLLRAAGFDAETFSSGTLFLESLKTHQPDCVLLDLNMPHLDGLAVQERLNQAGLRLPIVISTARDSEASRNHALAAGASACLSKMVDGQVLLDAITTAIAHTPGHKPPPEKHGWKRISPT